MISTSIAFLRKKRNDSNSNFEEMRSCKEGSWKKRLPDRKKSYCRRHSAKALMSIIGIKVSCLLRRVRQVLNVGDVGKRPRQTVSNTNKNLKYKCVGSLKSKINES